MKIHRPIQIAIEKALASIFIDGRHAEKTVDHYLKNEKKWGGRDRRQFAEIVYDIVRSWRTFVVLSGFDFNSAQIDENIISQVVLKYVHSRDNQTEFQVALTRLSRAERESIPDWLDQWGVNTYGASWDGILSALNTPARQYLRANTLRCDLQTLQKKLSFEQVETVPVEGVPSALMLKERKNVFQTTAYKSGLFEMQDAGSQLIAPFLKVEPGERVVDACAGAGGKTLHLAAMMKNKGQIIALDIHDWKLTELKLRARRAGVSIIETRLIENTKVIKRLEGSADRLLLDVPCSGLGVLRRHPDTKWKLSRDEMVRLEELQTDILERYSSMVKPGGTIVYATCSIAPTENENIVKAFLARHPETFTLEEELKTLPQSSGFDGFYAARIIRVSL